MLDSSINSCLLAVVTILDEARILLVRLKVLYKKRGSLLILNLIIVWLDKIWICHPLFFYEKCIFDSGFNSVLRPDLAIAIVKADLLAQLFHKLLYRKCLPNDLIVLKSRWPQLDIVLARV